MIWIKKIVRILVRLFLGLLGLLLLIFCFITAPAWYKNWVTYPRLDKERTSLQELHKPQQNLTEHQDFQGVLHSHTYWSHDSRGVIEEILPAAQRANLDFIFLSDHKRHQLDTFPRGYHGMYDGILIESGTESNQIMVTPMDTTILDWSKGEAHIRKEIMQNEGMVWYVHSEEEHDWSSPDYHGMEIYNIHTDFIDEKGIFSFLVNSMVNGKSYRHWAYREIYNDQPLIWAKWDSLNQYRKIVGMAAVDAHDNQSIRARYLENGQVEWVGSNVKTLEIVEPGWREKWLLGTPDAGGWVFRLGIDDYFHSFNFVNTHVLADTLSRYNLKKHLLAGHVYIAFESLAKAKGFQFYATDHEEKILGIMGDSIPASQGSLKALSPFPVQFQLIRNGELLEEKNEAYSYEYNLNGKSGNYRIVARLKLDGEWICWVMTNLIYVHDA